MEGRAEEAGNTMLGKCERRGKEGGRFKGEESS